MDLTAIVVLKWALFAYFMYRIIRRVWNARARARSGGRPVSEALRSAIRWFTISLGSALISGAVFLINTRINGPNPKWFDRSLIAIFIASCAGVAITIAKVGNRARDDEMRDIQ